MRKTIRIQVALAVVFLMSSVMCFSQSSGEAVYTAKCLSCHGANGLAQTILGRALKVKPVDDPAVKKFTFAEMMDATRNGIGKMQPFKDKLDDSQIKDSVLYFRSLIK